MNPETSLVDECRCLEAVTRALSRHAPPRAGTTNDVMFRLVDNDAFPTTELRSACMMITAR
jgi:hypothetical protein